MKNIEQTIPISLYIHAPWCIRKCPYCDFNSHVAKHELPEAAYLAALLTECEERCELIGQRPVQSIFIGGGTPSLFAPETYSHLLQKLSQRLNITTDCEITLEANPGTVEQQRFIGYRQAGINRLSLGLQSLQDEKLKALGRIHNSQQALAAVGSAQQAGFNNINVDLMYGLPLQSMEDALYDLKTAIALNITHLSWYQLTLEPNTYFFRYPPRLPNDEKIEEIQQQGQRLLIENDFTHYEISAYCREQRTAQHNLNYWQFGDYLGLGAGAHSKITCPITHTINRHWNVKHPNDYLNPAKATIANQKQLSKKELALEFMLNALRLQHPIPIHWLTQRTGLKLADIETPIKQAIEQQLLELNTECFIVTPLGKRYLNNLLELFL